MFLSSPKGRTLALVAAVALFASAAYADGISAIAGYTYTQVSPGVYDYSLTLDNTGTTTIGTFWFSWIVGAGFLPSPPSDITSPAGWNPVVTNGGKAIQWTTALDLLAPDTTVSGFSFESDTTPAQMAGLFPGPGLGTGDPVSTAFVYIAAPLADPGFQFDAMPTPEPGSWLLLLSGMALAAISFRSRLFVRA